MIVSSGDLLLKAVGLLCVRMKLLQKEQHCTAIV